MKQRKIAEFSQEKLSQYTHSHHAPYKCKDCDYTNDSPNSLVMHWNRKHGGMLAPGQEKNGKVGKLNLSKEGKLNAERYALDVPATVEYPPVNEMPAKRKWTRRQQPEVTSAERTVNWCPCCGTDLRAVGVAMNLR